MWHGFSAPSMKNGGVRIQSELPSRPHPFGTSAWRAHWPAEACEGRLLRRLKNSSGRLKTSGCANPWHGSRKYTNQRASEARPKTPPGCQIFTRKLQQLHEPASARVQPDRFDLGLHTQLLQV